MTGCILLAAGFLLTVAARLCEGFAEWYSVTVYPVWVNVLGRGMNVVPFSVAEILLYVTVILVSGSGIRLLWRIYRRRAGKAQAERWGCNLLLLAGILYFLYVVNCGINYHRTSFAEKSGIRTDTYTVLELQQTCLWLTEEVNDLAGLVERRDDGVMQMQEEPDVQERAEKAMGELGEIYPELSGYYPRPKGLLFPWILSVQKLSGIYSPFTIEANYNTAMVDYNIPFTACHELSHLKGFMEEQEANFIAFLSCTESEDEEFRYSGYLLGWIYCMNVLYDSDYDAWLSVRESLCEEAEKDLAANREFWASYDGRAAEVARQVNDHYLKANGQTDGVKSYDRMVDLIVAWYENYI